MGITVNTPILLLVITMAAEGSIYKNLKYFETIHAKHVAHTIVKRGLSESTHPFNKIQEINFNTLGRDFRLILTPKRNILHSRFKAYAIDSNGNESPVHIDHDEFYDGRVFGEISSQVSLHIDDGVITGNIAVPDEVYYIEPSWRHTSEYDDRTMITYKQSDVKFSWDHSDLPSGQIGPRICGYQGDEFQYENDNRWTNDTSHKHRDKRQIDQFKNKPSKTRCPLLLVADYRFFQAMGGNSTKITVNYLISLIDRVHTIYNKTLWRDSLDTDGFKGMGFLIKKILVHSEPTHTSPGEIHYNMFRKNYWDVRNLLEVFARNPLNKEACLAHLFTHQTFDAKSAVVLGLAYIASSRRRSLGGICSEEYVKNGYTLYLNAGLSSSRNHYGQRVITREADLVTTHEFGHNWGSEHDPDIRECSPSASHGGSYLMYTYSVSGYDVNNKRFSPCSIRSIYKVLQAKSALCFTVPEESFCGNLRIEGDEECDAGLLGTDDNDSCCDNDCKLRPGAVCSDKNSPCCQNCQFMSGGVKCRESQYATCEQESKCTGYEAECPQSPPMDDGTACQEKGKCKMGKCLPFCETIDMQSCMCDVIANACKRCCRTNINETCSPIDHQDILPDGTPCIQGYCNKGICEKTVQDVVERFWHIIEDININKVLHFLRDNIVGSVVLLSALLWIPASCVICHFDRKRRKEKLDRFGWDNRSELIHPSDRRKVIHVRVPKPRNLYRPTIPE